jgi:RNA polymerase sigma-70 factor (ECF subfamily)
VSGALPSDGSQGARPSRSSGAPPGAGAGVPPGGIDDLTAAALAAGTGDLDAFRRVVRGSQRDVWRLCSHLGGRDVADDLSQETYLRAWRALPAFRAESSVRTWLLTIARRVAADHVRAQRRRRRLSSRIAPIPADPGTTGAVDIELLISGLDEDRRLAVYLTQILGLSYAEAAVVCGCPTGTIRSRVARARTELIEGFRRADAR